MSLSCLKPFEIWHLQHRSSCCFTYLGTSWAHTCAGGQQTPNLTMQGIKYIYSLIQKRIWWAGHHVATYYLGFPEHVSNFATSVIALKWSWKLISLKNQPLAGVLKVHKGHFGNSDPNFASFEKCSARVQESAGPYIGLLLKYIPSIEITLNVVGLSINGIWGSQTPSTGSLQAVNYNYSCLSFF